MFLITLILILTVNVLADNPLEVWEKLRVTESLPVQYDEIVVFTESTGVSVRYYNVLRKDANTQRREETGHYSNEVLQVVLQIDDANYLWLDSVPYIYQTLDINQSEDWFAKKLDVMTSEDEQVLVLTLESKLLPIQVKQFINSLDMTLFKEEVYRRGQLVQVRERRNINNNPELAKELFELPTGYEVFSDRHSWERALVYELLSKNSIYDIYYPKWLPPNWVLADINTSEFFISNNVVYRFFDGNEFYSLFIRPLSVVPNKSQVSVVYKGSMGVFQIINNGYIITLVGRLQEKEALKIIESLIKLDCQSNEGM